MRKIILLAVMLLSLVVSSAAAEEKLIVGDPELLDGTAEQGLLINAAEFFAQHTLGDGKAARSDSVFKSPRIEVTLLTNRSMEIALHYHVSCDETVLIHKGRGEIYLNGKWVPVKAGDIHINPRGVIHGVRVTEGEDMKVISLFTPPQAEGNDKVFLKR